MASKRAHGNRIRLKAYAGVNPATGKPHYLYDSVPADVGKRELDRRVAALNAAANPLLESRRARRRDPAAPRQPRVRPARDRNVADAVEAWWKHHGSKLASAPKIRPLIDGIILPNLGDLRIVLVDGTPPDDETERDPDLVYLSERWAAIAKGDRKVRPDENGEQPVDPKTGKPVAPGPLKPSVIHRCHGIVGAALRRAGRPIVHPGLPSMGGALETTPLAEEMTDFLPYLAGTGRRSAAYTVTRTVRGGDGRTVTYEVPGRVVPTNAMDLMTEAFALLVAAGPRPVEAAAITRAQLDLDGATLELDSRGVVEQRDAEGREVWVIATGETAKRRRRTITLDARALGALRRWVAFQDEAALAMGRRLGPRALVFSLDPAGVAPVSPKVFSGAFARTVDRAVEAGVALPEGFHLYDMRHFGVTQMLRLGHGRNVAAVARRFGTSTRMIQQRYEHAIPDDDAALADIMTGVWGDTDLGNGKVVPLQSAGDR